MDPDPTTTLDTSSFFSGAGIKLDRDGGPLGVPDPQSLRIAVQ